MKFAVFIQEDIDKINEKAAWTPDQKIVFDMLVTDKYTDVSIMQAAHIGNNKKYYTIKKQIIRKVERILMND